MIGKANNEIHELIRGIRLELQDLRKDLQNLEKKQDGFNNISDGKQAKIVMSRPGSITFNL